MIYEKNMIQKNLKNIDLRFGLCYPNVYKTAMSSLGYNILYNFINDKKEVFAERIIFPNTRSIETKSPLRDFDIISFSLQYEEDYFNVLKMLQEGGIPLKRSERSVNDPLIIAGGPCATANPKPMADFIDIFVIGEGEVILGDLINSYLENGKNLEKFSEIEGIYVSKLDNYTKLQIVNNMDHAYHVNNPIIWDSDDEIFKDSIMINVSRGCTRGCRFCMSSYLYRPMRETSLECLIKTAHKLRENTGYNRVILIGAAVSDYSKIVELIKILEDDGFEISTPSMRIESITGDQLEILRKSNLKTITIAPESIEKLRKSINKELSDDKIISVVKDSFDLGFNMKLYFIIGLPNETMEDINELVDFMKYLASFRNGNSIRFSINPLIPKPHTPLQWNSYNIKDIKKKMRFIKREMRNYKLKVESPKKGMIQYILSCGNKDISNIIEKSIFSKITLKEWKENIPNYSINDKLPWDNIDVGVKKEFLIKEYEKIKTGQQTPWCEKESCYNCGACK